jgi:CheY-like chemotaxis protein
MIDMKPLPTILFVEDNRMDIELTLDAFREAHLPNPIQIVRDGQDALDYMLGMGQFTDRTAYPLPALILLDLKLPRVDGLQVLRTLKTTPKVRRIPTIVLTSSKEEGDLTLSYDLGVNSYLVKPISYDGFIRVIQSLDDYWLHLNLPPPLLDS